MGRDKAQGSGWGGDSGAALMQNHGEGADLGKMLRPVWDLVDVGGPEDIQGVAARRSQDPWSEAEAGDRNEGSVSSDGETEATRVVRWPLGLSMFRGQSKNLD